MGMLIDGKWDENADGSMVDGAYRREQSTLRSSITATVIQDLAKSEGRYFLVASASCPWSHGAVIALVLAALTDAIKIQWAGGPRIEGYGFLPGGPIPDRATLQHVHQLYTATDAAYTGRATVPVLWDAQKRHILSNSSADIIEAFDAASVATNLWPSDRKGEVRELIQFIFDGLSNAVYRAGKSQRQDEYDEAVDTVFRTMDALEARLEDRKFLFGEELTAADIRLFATLVRFDTVYATHFRCTRRRLVDYPMLWRFTRWIYQMPGIKETVDFDEIRFGYYVNDGSHNPFGIVGQQPEIDWEDWAGLDDH
ncbi:MAG: glutathione S-transferase C-terminal domain-containing protein [Pseudomonadota bacterium]